MLKFFAWEKHNNNRLKQTIYAPKLKFRGLQKMKHQSLKRYYKSRRVARVLSLWKHFQAGGLGAALRPPLGPGQSPGGGPGGEASGS